jgi:hypothetical protein
LSCFARHESDGRRIEVVVRVVDGQTVAEEVACNDRKRRQLLLGTSAILFVHIDGGGDDDDDARTRLRTLVQSAFVASLACHFC